MIIDEKGQIAQLHKGGYVFIRRDFSVQTTKQTWNDEQLRAIFLMFIMKFLRDFYGGLGRNALSEDTKRDQVSLYKLSSNRPDIAGLFESMTPYLNSKTQLADELLQLKTVEGVYVSLNTDKNLCASIFNFTDPWKIDILEFMERDYMNDIPAGEIANYTERGLSTFKRDSRKCSTLSSREWLIQCHLEAAHGLIREGGRKISEICFEIDSKDLSYFPRIYKITHGVPPTEDI